MPKIVKSHSVTWSAACTTEQRDQKGIWARPDGLLSVVSGLGDLLLRAIWHVLAGPLCANRPLRPVSPGIMTIKSKHRRWVFGKGWGRTEV